MTNSQINLEIAVKALDTNKLSGSAKSFIEDIKGYSKKQLNALSSKQYLFLRDIADQNS